VIVISELNACFLCGFAAFVEEFGGLFPAIGGVALFRLDPGIDDEFMADDVGGVECFGLGFFESGVWNVTRRSGETIFIEESANVFGGMVEIAREFDFFVADGSDLGDGAFEIGFHCASHGVKLNADGFQLSGKRSGPGSFCNK